MNTHDGMTWDEWCNEYPCPIASKLPERFDWDYCNRVYAEKHIEQDGAVGVSRCIVKFGRMYYIVTPEYAKELTGSEDIY